MMRTEEKRKGGKMATMIGRKSAGKGEGVCRRKRNGWMCGGKEECLERMRNNSTERDGWRGGEGKI